MCFSAAGSFALSGVLATLGTASLIYNSSKARRMFAAIPLLFAAQQATEGIVWLTLAGTQTPLNRLAVSAFLGTALVVWPIWVPIALRLVERDRARQRALSLLLFAGAGVAISAFRLMVRFPPFAQISGHSLRYEFEGRGSAPIPLGYLVAYLVPTVLPFFVSKLSMARVLGTVLVGSLLASVAIQRDALTSIWCFFAAILSGLILVALRREQRAL